MNGTQHTGAVLALAAASLFSVLSTAGSEAQTAANDVHCYGINACKGQNDCATDTHSCKGEGSCKGTGWVSKPSVQECTKAGGQVGK